MVVGDRYVRGWLARRSSRPGAGGSIAGPAAQPNVVLCVVVTRFPHFGEGFGLNYGVGW